MRLGIFLSFWDLEEFQVPRTQNIFLVLGLSIFLSFWDLEEFQVPGT